jgi:hypothetical protein
MTFTCISNTSSIHPRTWNSMFGIYICSDDFRMMLTTPRFKNYEAGKLTSLSEQPLEKTPREQTFEYGSETDLSKSDHDKKSFGGTTVMETPEGLDLEQELQGTSLSSIKVQSRLTQQSKHSRGLLPHRLPRQSHVRLCIS